MKSLKFLNFLLTVIASCLIILTLSVIGTFPKAQAASNSNHLVNEPNRLIAINPKIQSGNLISFPKADGNGSVYVNKQDVIQVVFVNSNLSQIYLPGGVVTNVIASASTVVNAVNQ